MHCLVNHLLSFDYKKPRFVSELLLLQEEAARSDATANIARKILFMPINMQIYLNIRFSQNFGRKKC